MVGEISDKKSGDMGYTFCIDSTVSCAVFFLSLNRAVGNREVVHRPQAPQGASEVGRAVRTVEPHCSAQPTLPGCALDVLREVPVDFFTELGLFLLEAP